MYSLNSIEYYYDGRGNKIKKISGNIQKSFIYNTAGLLAENEILGLQKVNYSYNEMGQVVRVLEDGKEIATYQYDILGRKTSADFSNGTRERTVYNAAGLVTKLTNSLGNSVISQYEYTYYYDGNQKTKTDSSGVTSYVYDGLGRLLKAIFAGGTVQDYEFDKSGNRTKLTETKANISNSTYYSYDQNDRLIIEIKDGESIDYTYDNNGNLIYKSGDLNRSGVSQNFDLLNRMTSYSTRNISGTYAYNPDNMRKSKTVNGSSTEHVWIGSEIALDICGSGIISYVSGIRSDYGWYLYNAHGDVVQLADDYGEVVTFYDYDPFGVQLESDGNDRNPYRYCGEYFDFESGYVYLRARYYDPYTGRFISEDPALDGYNWYVYCGNNPVNRWDPSGCKYFGTALGEWALDKFDNGRYKNELKRFNKAKKNNDIVLMNESMNTMAIRGWKDDSNYDYMHGNDTMALLGVHAVGPWNHASVIVMAAPVEEFPEGADYTYAYSGKVKYATIGAGTDGLLNFFPKNLVSKTNRKKDVKLGLKKESIDLNAGKETINDMFSAEKYYSDNYDDRNYDWFPSQYTLGYNSNSFVSGLLGASGITPPKPSYSVPGYNKPLPPVYFGRLLG